MSSSCVTVTVRTRMSAKSLWPEIAIPSLQKLVTPLTHEPDHIADLVCCEAIVPCHNHPFQPHLCAGSATFYVDMRWLISIVADEIQPEAAFSHDGRRDRLFAGGG